MYLGKVSQWLRQTLGKGEQGLLGQVLIRAFQREPSSLTPDRLLEEGYEMKPEGKYCTTGKPRLSWQLRPPQGVNYTQTDRHFRKRFSVCHKNKHSLASPALEPSLCADVQPERASQEAEMGSVSAAAQRGNLTTRAEFPFPLTVSRWPLQCGPICTCAGHPAPVFLLSVATHFPPHSQALEYCKTQISLYCIFSPQNLQTVTFSSKMQFRGKNRLTCIDD